MARLTLNSGESVGLSSGTYNIFGTSAGKETVTIAAAATVTLDASFNAGGDTVTLAGNAADYTAVRSGSALVLTHSSGGVVTIPVGTTASTVAFADASRSLVFNTTSSAVELGSQAVTSTAAAVSAGTGGSTAGQTFTLTTGIDAGTAFVGTDRADTFYGTHAATGSTLTLGDTVDGGSGNDALDIVSNDATAITAPRTTSVETYNLQLLTTGASLAVNAATTGLTSVNVNNSSVAAFGLTNLALTTALGLNASDTAITAGFVGTSGTADSVAINLSNTTTNAAVNVGAGVETINVSSGGTANTLASLVGAAATKAVITGAGNLTITAALADGLDTVDASAFTGKLNISVASDASFPDATVSSVDVVDRNISGGSGNDTINLSALLATAEIKLDAGAGDDVVTIGAALENAATATAGDVLAGGSGTDTLVADADLVDASVATALTGVSGFEVLGLDDLDTAAGADVVTVANISADITTVQVLDALAQDLTVNFAAGSSNVELKAAVSAGKTLTIDAAGTGTSDSVTITNKLTTGDIGSTTSVLAVTDFETVTLNTGSYTTAATQNVNTLSVGANALVITGSNGLTTAGSITAKSIDASASGALVMGVAATSVTSITGSAKADTLRGDASSTISGGAGNDTIVGGTGNDVLNGDDGDDTITMGAGVDNVNSGAGDDIIVAAGNITSADTINGGAGLDVLSLTAGSIAAAQATGISGIEFLAYDAAGAVALSTDETGLSGLLGVVLNTAGNAVTGATAGLGVYANASTAASSWALTTATGSSDTVTINLSSAAAITLSTFTSNGVETFNVKTTDTNTTAHQDTVTLAGDANTAVNVSGSAGVILTATATTKTVDASGLTVAATASGLNYTSGNTVVGEVTTITGSGGIDTLKGSASAQDNINGGAGADIISDTAGKDVLTGGAGNDTFKSTVLGTATALTTVADFTVGDKLDVDAIDGAGTTTFATAAVTGLGSNATLGNYLDAAAATVIGANSKVSWFNFGGDTYVVLDNSASITFDAADSVVKLSGVLDLSDSTISSGVITFG